MLPQASAQQPRPMNAKAVIIPSSAHGICRSGLWSGYPQCPQGRAAPVSGAKLRRSRLLFGIRCLCVLSSEHSDGVSRQANPTPIIEARYSFGVQFQCMSEAMTAKMIRLGSKLHCCAKSLLNRTGLGSGNGFQALQGSLLSRLSFHKRNPINAAAVHKMTTATTVAYCKLRS